MKDIDWKSVKNKIESHQWAKDLYDGIKSDTDEFIGTYDDDVSKTAGWGHNFHCDHCSGRLEFNIRSPHEHKCTVCGKINRGPKKDNAWTASYRSRTFGMIFNAAVLYNLEKNEAYPAFIRKVMDFFADNYDDFTAESPAKRFEGKLTGINLSDATSIIQGVFGLDMTRECFSSKEMDKWHKNLFMPQADMYDQFSNKIYNIPAWMKAAEGIIGIFFNDKKIIDRAFYSRFGIMDQMRRGVTKEGMWFEYSPHYHFYCAHPITYLVYFAKRYELDIPDSKELYDHLEKLYMYPIKNMFRNGYLPNPGDGWPEIHITKYKNQMEYAATVLDNDYIKQVIGTCYLDGKEKSSAARLLFNPGYENKGLPVFGSQNNEDSFNAILKNGQTEVFVKTGITTISHAHPDVMNIELAFYDDLVSYDLGSNGYSTRIFNEWQHKSISHNTVVLDMMDQKYEPVGEGIWPEGIVEHYDENRIRAKSKNVYECCDYTRDLRIDGPKLYDEFTIRGVEQYTIDWLFYCEGELLCDYDTVESGPLGDGEGYQHLFNIRGFVTDDDWRVVFKLKDKSVTVGMKGEPGTKIYLFDSYTFDFNTTRPGILVRRQGSQTVYETEYECVKRGV